MLLRGCDIVCCPNLHGLHTAGFRCCSILSGNLLGCILLDAFSVECQVSTGCNMGSTACTGVYYKALHGPLMMIITMMVMIMAMASWPVVMLGAC
jgi:hypothetical protein